MKATSSRHYPASPERLWKLITNPSDFTWRSQISTATQLGSVYTETSSRSRYTTTYTITHDTQNERRDTTLTHADGTGTRSFILTSENEETTRLDIVEQFEFNGPAILRPLVNRFLKNQRQALLNDLTKAT